MFKNRAPTETYVEFSSLKLCVFIFSYTFSSYGANTTVEKAWPQCPPFLYDIVASSVAEPHHFYAAPGENFDAAPAAPAPAPTLLYSKAKFLKRTKVYTHVETILFI
jgi:hypothetical protein